MAYEQRPNQGSLFPTKVKTNPKSPDYFGDILVDVSSLNVVDGMAKIKLGGWKKKVEATGNTFLSLQVDTWKPDGSPQPEVQDDDIDF